MIKFILSDIYNKYWQFYKAQKWKNINEYIYSFL